MINKESLYGTKELYDLQLKASFPIEINGRKYETGEPIVSFRNIQVISFDEVVSKIAARGGKHNRAQVIWEDTHEIPITFRQGVFSKQQFGILTNTLMVPQEEKECLVPQIEETESDENGAIILEHLPASNLFIYNNKGEKITNYTIAESTITGLSPYTDYQINYNYLYESSYQNYIIGSKYFNGFLTLEAKMRLKDDTTGKNITGLIKLNRVRLMSDLSITLGADLPPMVANFNITAFPSDIPGDSDIGSIIWLDTDIDE